VKQNGPVVLIVEAQSCKMYGVLIQSLKEKIDAQKNKYVAEAIGIDLCRFI